jgi:hypothetical protein
MGLRPSSQSGRIQVFTGWRKADGMLKIGEKTSLSSTATNSVSSIDFNLFGVRGAPYKWLF